MLIIESFFYGQNKLTSSQNEIETDDVANKMDHIRPASPEMRIKIEQPAEKRARFMTSDMKGPCQHQRIEMEQATYNSAYERYG